MYLIIIKYTIFIIFYIKKSMVLPLLWEDLRYDIKTYGALSIVYLDMI